MDTNKKLSLLNEDLDDASAEYIREELQNWKEGVMAQLQDEVERAKQAKLDELEEQNLAYRQELKEEYSEKFLAAVSEIKESVKADVTASVLKNNPELKIFEEIKSLIAPTLNEDYRNEAYSNTIAQLAEENEALRREQELMEGAQALTELLSPYGEKTQKLVLSMIKEGSPEEVTEQFYTIMESLQDVFGEAEDDDDEEKKPAKGSASEDDDDDDDEDDDDEDDDDDDGLDESYIYEGFNGDDDDDDLNEDVNDMSSLKNVIRHYVK